MALCLVLHVLIKFNKALHSEISLNSASVYSLTKLSHQNVSFGRKTRSEPMFNKLSITYDVLTARNRTPEILPQITWKHYKKKQLLCIRFICFDFEKEGTYVAIFLILLSPYAISVMDGNAPSLYMGR